MCGADFIDEKTWNNATRVVPSVVPSSKTAKHVSMRHQDHLRQSMYQYAIRASSVVISSLLVRHVSIRNRGVKCVAKLKNGKVCNNASSRCQLWSQAYHLQSMYQLSLRRQECC